MCEYIKEPSDWYYVSISQIRKLGGNGFLNFFSGSLLRALHAVYPGHVWQSYKFSRPHQIVSPDRSVFGKVQFMLFQLLQQVSMLGSFIYRV